jgi:hypothetical protein
MAEMWYYTSEGKQMEPVTSAELKQLAASGLLKPTDMVWTDGMPKWVRASSTQDLFAVGGLIPVKEEPAGPEDSAGKDAPRRAKRRDADRYDDEDEDRPRRRRRAAEPAGMDMGLKVGLILGGSLLGIALIVVVIIIATRSGNDAQVKIRQAPPIAVPFNNPPMINNGPMAINPPVNTRPPVFRGPVAVGPGGLVFNEQLTNTDPRDGIMQLAPCKVFAINMTAGKTYTIRHDDTNNNNFNNKNNFLRFDPFLRLEDSNFVELARDDDSGGNLNALLIFRPLQTGVYRVIATSLGGMTGSFSLKITEN